MFSKLVLGNLGPLAADLPLARSPLRAVESAPGVVAPAARPSLARGLLQGHGFAARGDHDVWVGTHGARLHLGTTTFR